MRFGYVFARPLPSRDTDTQQVMKMLDALSAEGAEVELILPETRALRRAGTEAFADELARFYSLRHAFGLRPLRGIEPSRLELERPAHALLCSLVIRRDEYDVVHTRSRSAALLCALRGDPVVFETYRLLGKEQPLFVRSLARVAARPNFLGIVTHSRVSLESIAGLGFPRAKLATLHNGYDPDDFSPRLEKAEARAALGLSPNAAVCCYTGDLRARKGIAALLDLAACTPEVEYLIAGGRPEDIEAVRRECDARGLHHVRLLGWRPAAELRPLLYAADVLLVPPSRSPLAKHGRTVLPMKIFSYLAAGRVILAPTLPDLAEVLEHGKNAWLVPPDDPDAAATALRHLLAEPELAAALGRGALESAAGLTWRARAQKLLAQVAAWRGA